MEASLLAGGLLAFWAEIFAPLLLCSSVPFSIPPAPQDPALARVAPQECAFYFATAGTATPDPASRNRAERFLADPEIRHMRAEAARRFKLLAKSQMKDASLGSAGEAGKVVGRDVDFWYELLFARPMACFISRCSLDPKAPNIDGGLVMNVGDARARIAALLEEYRKLAGGAIEKAQVTGNPQYQLKDGPVKLCWAQSGRNGDAYLEWQLKDGPVKLGWALGDKYLIVAWGGQSPQAIAKRMSGEEPAWMTAIGKDLPVQRRAAVLHVEIKPILAALAAADKESAKKLGDVHLRALSLVTGLDQEDFVSRVLVEFDDVVAKPLHLMADCPLRPDDLASIPRDATLAVAFRADLKQVLRGLKWLQENAEKHAGPGKQAGALDAAAQAMGYAAEELLPDTAKGYAAAFRGTPGLGLEAADLWPDMALCEEVAACVDDAWCLYTSPGEGVLVFTGATATVRVKDRDRLAKMFERLAAHQPAKAGTTAGGKPAADRWAVRKTRFAEHDVYYLVRSAPNAPGTLTWCLTDSELVLSLSPQQIKAVLLREAGSRSLGKTPVVAEVLKSKQPPTMLLYEDAPELFRLTYPFMQVMANLAAAQNNLHLEGPDPMLLPAAPTIAKYLRPAVSTVRATPKGVELTLRQSLPCGNLGATLWVVGCSVLPASANWSSPAEDKSAEGKLAEGKPAEEKPVVHTASDFFSSQTLPTPNYLQDDVQYFSPGPLTTLRASNAASPPGAPAPPPGIISHSAAAAAAARAQPPASPYGKPMILYAFPLPSYLPSPAPGTFSAPQPGQPMLFYAFPVPDPPVWPAAPNSVPPGRTAPSSSSLPPGGAAVASMAPDQVAPSVPRPPLPPITTSSKLAFVGPPGITILLDKTNPGPLDSSPLLVPAIHDFPRGAVYRLKLTKLPGRPAVELNATIEVASVRSRGQAFLAHDPIPVQFTDEDFDQALQGNVVTKAIYLPDPQFQTSALGAAETLVSTRLDPGVDPIIEANGRGTILAVVRLGKKQL